MRRGARTDEQIHERNKEIEKSDNKCNVCGEKIMSMTSQTCNSRGRCFMETYCALIPAIWPLASTRRVIVNALRFI